MDKDINRYKLVHEVSKLAKEMEEENRNPIQEQVNNIYKEVNKSKKRRNYVVDAFEQITKKKDDDK